MLTYYSLDSNLLAGLFELNLANTRFTHYQKFYQETSDKKTSGELDGSSLINRINLFKKFIGQDLDRLEKASAHFQLYRENSPNAAQDPNIPNILFICNDLKLNISKISNCFSQLIPVDMT